MACPSFKEKISAYLDGLPGHDERAEVEEHLKSCSRCREYYDELSRSVSSLRNLKEVEPPPWLKQKVMARIREDSAPRQSFWKKLLYPFNVKIPVGAVATIALAVITIYIFRSMEPAVRMAKTPPDEAARTGVPATVKPKDSEKTGVFQKKAPGQAVMRSAQEAELPVPVKKKPGPQPRAAAPATGDVSATASEEDKKAAVPESRALPTGPAEHQMKEAFSYQARTDLPGSGEAREETKKSVSPAPAKMPAAQGVPLGAAQDAQKSERASAVPGMKSSAEMKKKEDASLAILVKDLEIGSEEIGRAVRTAGGTIISEESYAGKRILVLSIPPQQYRGLLEKLRSMGDMARIVPDQQESPVQIRFRIEIIEKSR